MASFAGLDTQVLGISVDSEPCLKAWAKDLGGITYPLLSDFWPHGATATAYGVFLEQLGAANRGTFIIDADGVLRWSVVTGLGEPRETGDYLKALAEIG